MKRLANLKWKLVIRNFSEKIETFMVVRSQNNLIVFLPLIIILSREFLAITQSTRLFSQTMAETIGSKKLTTKGNFYSGHLSLNVFPRHWLLHKFSSWKQKKIFLYGKKLFRLLLFMVIVLSTHSQFTIRRQLLLSTPSRWSICYNCA